MKNYTLQYENSDAGLMTLAEAKHELESLFDNAVYILKHQTIYHNSITWDAVIIEITDLDAYEMGEDDCTRPTDFGYNKKDIMEKVNS